MIRRARRPVLIAALLCATPLWSAGIVGASVPADDGTTTPIDVDATDPTLLIEAPDAVEPVGEAVTEVIGDRATIALVDAGLGNGFELESALDSRDFVVTVPDSMHLTDYAVDLSTSPSADDVLVTVSVDGQVVEEQRWDGGVDGTIRADLGERTGEVTVTVAATDLAPPSCSGAGAGGAVVSFANAQLGFDHDASVVPSTVADFLPPLLSRAVVVIPDEPSDNELSGAYRLAAALARRYPVAPEFKVLPSDSVSRLMDGSDDPFERVFLLGDGDVTEIAVIAGGDEGRDVVMSLTAPDGELGDLAAALSAPEIGFITTATTAGVPVGAEPSEEKLLQTRSLEAVGVTQLEVAGGRSVDFPIRLSQSRFGQPVSSMRLQLSGLVISAGTPTVSVRLNEQLVDVLELGPTGGFEIDVEIDSRTIGRDNLLVIRSEIAGCGDSAQQQIVLDSDSSVEASPGQAISASLERFPQVGLADLLVAAGDSVHERRLALVAVASMQQASALAIPATASTVDAALATTTAALVVSDGSEPTGPTVAAAVERGAGVAPGLATIVAAENEVGGDIVAVLAPAGSPASDALADQLRLRGWTSFVGRAVGVDQDGERVVEGAAGRVSPAELDVLDEVESSSDERSPLVLFGFGALIVLAVAVLIMVIRSVVATFTGSRAR